MDLEDEATCTFTIDIPPPPPPSQEWWREFGTISTNDFGESIAVNDNGEIYVYSNILDSKKAFLAKYNSQGSMTYSQELPWVFGSVKVDKEGNFYVSSPEAIEKYNLSGNILMRKDFGTYNYTLKARVIYGSGIYIKDRNIYIPGNIVDEMGNRIGTFISKYDPSGNELWSKRCGIIGDYTFDGAGGRIAIDNNENIYAINHIRPNGNYTLSIRLSKYDSSGAFEWKEEIGSSSDMFDYFEKVNSICVDNEGNIYVVGYAYNRGTDHSIFFEKYGSSSSKLWSRSLGSGVGDDVSCNNDCVVVTGDVLRASQGWGSQWDVFLTRLFQDPYSIKGYVKDKEQNPIKGVSITLNGSDIFGNVSMGFTTDNSGYYEVFAFPGNYTVFPYKDGYSFDPEQRNYNNLDSNKTNQNFVGVKNKYDIKGYIKNQDGFKMKNVNISLSGDISRSYTTDNSGYYEFLNLAYGTYTITPTKRYFIFNPQTRTYTLLNSDWENQDFVGSTTQICYIKGYVKDKNGDGMDGVSVELSGDNLKTYETDITGYYEFIVAPENYIVFPSKQKYIFSPENRSYLPLDKDYENQDFQATLIEKSYIKGYIKDLKEEGVKWVSIILSGDISKSYTTDNSGYYEFLGLDFGNYVVSPSIENYSIYPENRHYAALSSSKCKQNFVIVPKDAKGGIYREWIMEFGQSTDFGYGASCDNFGNIYVVGKTGDDILLAKFDKDGKGIWREKMGSDKEDIGYGVVCDKGGNVYITGVTYGNLGGENQGDGDIFLAKFTSAGSHLWTKQFGTSIHEEGKWIGSDDAGNIYVGRNSDVFLTKYDKDGNELWGNTKKDMGILVYNRLVFGIGFNGFGDSFVGKGTLDSNGVHLRLYKYDKDGSILWTVWEYLEYQELDFSMEMDELDNIYVRYKDELLKYNSEGSKTWTKDVEDVEGSYIVADGLSNILTIRNSDSLMVLNKYNQQGEKIAEKELKDCEFFTGSNDSFGNVYIVGKNRGKLYLEKFYPFLRSSTITGTISYSGTKRGTCYVVYRYLEEKTPFLGGTFTVNGKGSYSYTINIPQGEYFISAWLDASEPFGYEKGPLDGDPYGIYKSLEAPESLIIEPGMTILGIDFELKDVVMIGTITGTISYSGTKRGTCYVVYRYLEEKTPFLGGTFTVNGKGSYSYTINIPQGEYFISAWLDASEPFGYEKGPLDGDPYGILKQNWFSSI